MADFSPRSFLRSNNGPQAVDSGHRRHSRDADDRSHKRSKRNSGEKKQHKARSEATPRPRASKTCGGGGGGSQPERPAFRLDVLSQPNTNIVLGMDVGITVLMTLQYSSPDLVPRSFQCDTGRLLAVASLVAETRTSERKALEAGYLAAPKLADSLRQVPPQFVADFKQSHPCRLILGFFSLSELTIRNAGYFRLRTTVLQAPVAGQCSSGPAVVVSTDSDLIRVDRRPAGYSSRRA